MIRARDRFPELHVVIQELESADAIEAVRDRRCHLAVSFAYNLAPRRDVAGLVSHRLLDEPVFLALPAPWRREREPIALERLAEEDWIVGSRQPDDLQLAERACAVAGFAPRITHTVDDYDLVLRMISAGLRRGLRAGVGAQRRDCSGLHTGGARSPARAFLTRALAASPGVRPCFSELAKTN